MILSSVRKLTHLPGNIPDRGDNRNGSGRADKDYREGTDGADKNGDIVGDVTIELDIWSLQSQKVLEYDSANTREVLRYMFATKVASVNMRFRL